MTKVIQVYRYKTPGKHSIEGLFQSINRYLKVNEPVRHVLKQKGAMPWVILRNILSVPSTPHDIIHVTGDVHYMAIGRKKAILTIHDLGSLLNNAGWKKLYYKLFWVYLPLKAVKLVTVISEFSKSELLSLAPWCASKLRVIPNTVDLERFRYHPKNRASVKPRILMVGTKVNKNIENMLRALDGLDCHVTVIGHMTEEQKGICLKLSLNYSIRVDISNDEIIEEYRNCDLLAFVSYYEGFGLPVLEAQAIGRPVITSKKGGLPEVGKEAVLYADPDQPSDIRKHIESLIYDPTLYEEMVKKGLKNVQEFRPEVIAVAYSELYKGLMDA